MVEHLPLLVVRPGVAGAEAGRLSGLRKLIAIFENLRVVVEIHRVPANSSGSEGVV